MPMAQEINTSMDRPFGRNKEITDEFSIAAQAEAAIAKARKSADGKLAAGDYGTGKKVVTPPPLSV